MKKGIIYIMIGLLILSFLINPINAYSRITDNGHYDLNVNITYENGLNNTAKSSAYNQAKKWVDETSWMINTLTLTNKTGYDNATDISVRERTTTNNSNALAETRVNVTDYRNGKYWIKSAALTINSSQNWSKYNLDSVLLHEMGHAMGLNHSEYENAIMYRTSNGLTRLAIDDTDGLASIYNVRPHSTTFESTSNLNEEMIYLFSYLAPLNEEELIEKADLIVKGEVKKNLPAVWNTENGILKSNDDINDYSMYHDVVIEIEEVYKGEIDTKEIYVRKVGGVIDNTHIITNSKEYNEGEKVILYLAKDTSSLTAKNGPEHYFELSEKGQIWIHDDGKTVNALNEEINIQNQLFSKL